MLIRGIVAKDHYSKTMKALSNVGKEPPDPLLTNTQKIEQAETLAEVDYKANQIQAEIDAIEDAARKREEAIARQDEEQREEDAIEAYAKEHPPAQPVRNAWGDGKIAQYNKLRYYRSIAQQRRKHLLKMGVEQ